MKYREIGKTETKVSSISFGASSLGGVFHSLREETGVKAVHTAVDNGINFIDVSPYYGHLKAKIVLGKTLNENDRNRYYLSTKIGRYGKDGVNYWNYSPEKARESVHPFCHHTLNDDAFVDYLDYFESKEVGVINASPYSMGLLTERGVPDWHPAPESLKRLARSAVKYCKSKGDSIEQLAVAVSVANPQISMTLFSTTSSVNVLKTIQYAKAPLDKQLLNTVQKIFEPDFRDTWVNS
jgi:aryl-alcohol dehydrogenase-like predicted oxidoreductase